MTNDKQICGGNLTRRFLEFQKSLFLQVIGVVVVVAICPIGWQILQLLANFFPFGLLFVGTSALLLGPILHVFGPKF